MKMDAMDVLAMVSLHHVALSFLWGLVGIHVYHSFTGSVRSPVTLRSLRQAAMFAAAVGVGEALVRSMGA